MTTLRHAMIQTASGLIPITVPNRVTEGTGFYVSYNDYDTTIYGGATTALVIGQMEKFYILNGDHRDSYAALMQTGLQACLDYFKANLASVNKFSDKLA